MSNPKATPPTQTQFKAIWKNQPTKMIRVPVCFESQLLAIAHSLDDGKPVSVIPVIHGNEEIESYPLKKLLEVQSKLPELIKQRQEATKDKRLENAIAILAGLCDGATSEDGRGFNKFDTAYGHWLAAQVTSGEGLLRHHAEKALKMIKKYQGQLSFELPQWEVISHQYPKKVEFEEDEEPEKRLILLGEMIACYSPYDQKQVAKFRAIKDKFPESRFNGDDKSWRFTLDAYKLIFESLEGYWIDPNLQGAIANYEREQLEIEEAKRKEAEEKAYNISHLLDFAELDKPLSNGWSLFPHQKEAVKWLLTHTREGLLPGGILADSMGLGKSLSALIAAKAIQRANNCPIFIICPASLKDNWLREADRAEVIIEVFSWGKMPKPLESSKYLVIADEAHYAQNIGSQRTKALLSLVKNPNCLGSWLLTGTPLKNGRPINLYPLLYACGHSLAPDEKGWNFQKYYCNADHRWVGKRSVWDNTGAAHLDELAKKTEDVIFRRTKKECLNLPPKLRSFKPVELKPEQAKEYRKAIADLVEQYRERVKAGEVDEAAEALVTLNYLRKVGSRYKVEGCLEIAEELLEQGQSVVIFTEFVESAKELHTKLGGELLIGETPADQRQAIVDRFQSGESKVFVGTIKAGGVGITLTAASNIVLLDRPWTPGDTEQAEDRCYRIGQSEMVTSFWVQLGLIDLSIDQLLESKQKRIELVLKGKRKSLKGLDKPAELAKQILEML